MTDATVDTWRIREAFVDADTEHKKLAAVHTNQCELVRKAQQDLRAHTFKLQRLLLARDLVQNAAFKFEGLTEEQEAGLALTGQDSEAWYCDYDNAADDLTELAVQLCGQVADLAKLRDRLQEAREKAWDARHAKACELRKAWDEASTDPAVAAAG